MRPRQTYFGVASLIIKIAKILIYIETLAIKKLLIKIFFVYFRQPEMDNYLII